MAKGSSARAGLLALLTIVAAVIVGVLMAWNSDEFLGIVIAFVGLPLAVLVWLMAIDAS